MQKQVPFKSVKNAISSDSHLDPKAPDEFCKVIRLNHSYYFPIKIALTHRSTLLTLKSFRSCTKVLL